MNRGSISSVLLLLSILAFAASCDQRREGRASGAPAPGADGSTGQMARLTGDARDAVATTTAYLIQQKEQVQKNLGQKMTHFDRQFADLKSKGSSAGNQVKAGWEKVLSDLQKRKDMAAGKLEALKNSGVDKWQDLKAGAEAAFDDLEKGLKDAFARTQDKEDASKP